MPTSRAAILDDAGQPIPTTTVRSWRPSRTLVRRLSIGLLAMPLVVVLGLAVVATEGFGLWSPRPLPRAWSHAASDRLVGWSHDGRRYFTVPSDGLMRAEGQPLVVRAVETKSGQVTAERAIGVGDEPWVEFIDDVLQLVELPDGRVLFIAATQLDVGMTLQAGEGERMARLVIASNSEFVPGDETATQRHRRWYGLLRDALQVDRTFVAPSFDRLDESRLLVHSPQHWDRAERSVYLATQQHDARPGDLPRETSQDGQSQDGEAQSGEAQSGEAQSGGGRAGRQPAALVLWSYLTRRPVARQGGLLLWDDGRAEPIALPPEIEMVEPLPDLRSALGWVAGPENNGFGQIERVALPGGQRVATGLRDFRYLRRSFWSDECLFDCGLLADAGRSDAPDIDPEQNYSTTWIATPLRSQAVTERLEGEPVDASERQPAAGQPRALVPTAAMRFDSQQTTLVVCPRHQLAVLSYVERRTLGNEVVGWGLGKRTRRVIAVDRFAGDLLGSGRSVAGRRERQHPHLTLGPWTWGPARSHSLEEFRLHLSPDGRWLLVRSRQGAGAVRTEAIDLQRLATTL